MRRNMQFPVKQACLLMAAALSLPAQAGLFNDDEARARIEQLRTQTNTRLDKLEAASRGQLELANQIEGLRQEVARLRGQVEVLTYEIESAQKRQKDFYVDLDNRMRKLESAQAQAQAPQTPQVDPMAETRDYEAALNLFKASKYRDAAAAFDNFIRTYPSSSFLPSANYWAATSHYQLREYNRASELYNTVVANWASDPRAPDALLGVANSQQGTGDSKGSRKTLETLVAKYPDTPAADTARQRLKKK